MGKKINRGLSVLTLLLLGFHVGCMSLYRMGLVPYLDVFRVLGAGLTAAFSVHCFLSIGLALFTDLGFEKRFPPIEQRVSAIAMVVLLHFHNGQEHWGVLLALTVFCTSHALSSLKPLCSHLHLPAIVERIVHILALGLFLLSIVSVFWKR